VARVTRFVDRGLTEAAAVRRGRHRGGLAAGEGHAAGEEGRPPAGADREPGADADREPGADADREPGADADREPGADVPASAKRGLAADVQAPPDQPALTRNSPALAIPEHPPEGLFTRYALDYAAQRPGQAVALLQAGCATIGAELDLTELRANGCHLVVSLIDEDHELTRAAVRARAELSSCILADLRSVPLAPRSYDIVHCSMLLGRISHAELVLGRFTSAIKPGGLMLLRIADRASAAGFLDRILPDPVRALIWRFLRPGEPGPYPAVHEPLLCARGIQSFALMHDLVIVHRQVSSRVAGQHGPGWLMTVLRLVSALSRGRLAWAHDELHYVIRKPENRFARLL
jgi:SAM-dependent methyltransferase